MTWFVVPERVSSCDGGHDPSGQPCRSRLHPFRTLPYLSPGLVLPYSASKGCRWGRCTFCPEKAEGNAYSALVVPMILSEIDRLVLSENPRLIHFLDNAMSPASVALQDHSSETPGTDSPDCHLTDPSFCRGVEAPGVRSLC